MVQEKAEPLADEAGKKIVEAGRMVRITITTDRWCYGAWMKVSK